MHGVFFYKGRIIFYSRREQSFTCRVFKLSRLVIRFPPATKLMLIIVGRMADNRKSNGR